MQLEICANSYQSAMNAQKAGAHRIELCSELSIGGITPSYQLLKKVMKNLHIPVHVLIRPRGGDFIYSKEEFEMMKENILICKELGSKGIVSGVLHTDNRIDIKRTQELIALSKPLSFTFHRAFDEVPEPMRANPSVDVNGSRQTLNLRTKKHCHRRFRFDCRTSRNRKKQTHCHAR